MNRKISHPRHWTEKEIEMLKKYYPLECHLLPKMLNRSMASIRARAQIHQLKSIKPKFRVTHDITDFIDIKKSSVAYILGFFWADGHIVNHGNEIKLKISKKDSEDIEKILLSQLPWRVYNNPNEGNGMVNFVISDFFLRNFLIENDYHLKSGASPNKILSKIPEYLRHFWWRGYFDGDGCLSWRKDGNQPTIHLTSCKEQNWDFYENLCEKLQIKFKHRIRIVNKEKNTGGSQVMITNIKECKTFLEYIFGDEKLGLSRKYEKFLEFQKNFEIPSPKTSKYIGVCVEGRSQKYLVQINYGGKKLYSKYFNCEIDAAQAREKFILDHKLDLALNFN